MDLSDLIGFRVKMRRQQNGGLSITEILGPALERPVWMWGYLKEKAKMDRRFYVGARHIARGENSTCKTTLDEAMAEAMDNCKATGEPQIVVEIVAAVRREERPVQIEVFKYGSSTATHKRSGKDRRRKAAKRRK